jgi:hypothetical protein
MKQQHPLMNSLIDLDISGKPSTLRGKLVDMGQDILVIHNGQQFVYVPIIHLQQMRPANLQDNNNAMVFEVPETPFEQAND